MPAEATDKKQLEVIRHALQQSQQVCAQSAELLDEPLRSMFTGLKKQFDDKLTALPPTEQVPAAMDMNWQLQSLYWCLDHLNTMFKTLNQSLSGMKSAQASLVTTALEQQLRDGKIFNADGLATAVAAEVKRLTDAGDLVTKEVSAQLCSSAKLNGVAEGETKVREEIAAAEARAKKAGERKTALQTASLPLPLDEAVLELPDEQFAARQTAATNRIAELAKDGIQLNSDLLPNVWQEEKEYTGFKKLVASIPALKSGAPVPEPFARPPGAAAGEAGLPFIA